MRLVYRQGTPMNVAARIVITFFSLAFGLGCALAQDEARGPQPIAGRTDSLLGKRIADVPVWKRVTLGTYKSVGALRVALDSARVRIGDSADEVLGRPAFHFSQAKADVDLVVVRVADLGFNDAISLGEIYRRAGELGLELCPPEVAPLVRLHYLDQPVGEFLNVAMAPITTYGREPVALSVANAGTGPLLIGGDGRPDLLMNVRAQFVFVRPARIAAPNVR